MPQPIQDIARKCLGWPYKEHGRDQGGIDCFGLYLLFAREMGKKAEDFQYRKEWADDGLNRLIEGYHQYAFRISRESLKSGDVILFKWHRTVINHMGIYLGAGRFIHCTERGVIQGHLNQQPFNRRAHSFYRLKDDHVKTHTEPAG